MSDASRTWTHRGHVHKLVRANVEQIGTSMQGRKTQGRGTLCNTGRKSVEVDKEWGALGDSGLGTPGVLNLQHAVIQMADSSRAQVDCRTQHSRNGTANDFGSVWVVI